MSSDTIGDRVGEILKEFCAAHGCTMRKVALDHLHIPVQTLDSMIHRGARRADPGVMSAIARLAGCNLEWLMSGQGEKYALVQVATGGWPQEVEGGMLRVELADKSMDLLDYRPRVVYAVPGAKADSGDIVVVEMRDGRRLVRKMYVMVGSVVLLVQDPHGAPEVVQAADIKRISKVWGFQI